MASLVWLVTGCSSGFGEQFVSSVLERGDKIIATARNPKGRTEHLKQQGATVIEMDLLWDEERIQKAVDEAVKIHGRIDVLINNAGYASQCFFEESK